jgi:hypothetical protein
VNGIKEAGVMKELLKKILSDLQKVGVTETKYFGNKKRYHRATVVSSKETPRKVLGAIYLDGSDYVSLSIEEVIGLNENHWLAEKSMIFLITRDACPEINHIFEESKDSLKKYGIEFRHSGGFSNSQL